MTGLIAAEVRKLRSVRTTYVLTAVGLLLVAVSVGFFLFEETLSGPFVGTDAQVGAAIDQIGGNSVIVLIVGLLVMTTEFRHGTIGRTLQITPRRSLVLLSKLGAGVAYALVFFVAGLVLVVVGILMASVLRDVDLDLGVASVRAVWHGILGLALTAVFGVALGALIRGQVVAVAVTLVWVFVAENLLNAFAPALGRWLPFQTLQAVFLSDEVLATMPQGMLSPLAPTVALVVFLGYVVLAAVAALAVLHYRDV